MSNKAEREAEDSYEAENDTTGDEVPSGDVEGDPEYLSRRGDRDPIPVDDAPAEDPIDPKVENSTEQLERDEELALKEGETVKERTRGATKPKGTYAEPGDEEGLPGPDDGTSSVR